MPERTSAVPAAATMPSPAAPAAPYPGPYTEPANDIETWEHERSGSLFSATPRTGHEVRDYFASSQAQSAYGAGLHMERAGMEAAYDALHALYVDIRTQREAMKQEAIAIQRRPRPRLIAGVADATDAAQAALAANGNRLVEIETYLVKLLEGMCATVTSTHGGDDAGARLIAAAAQELASPAGRSTGRTEAL